MKKQELDIVQGSLRLLKMNLKRLSSSYKEQVASIEDFALWNLPSDIATDWDNCEQVIDSIFRANLIDQNVAKKIYSLIKNFDEVSLNGNKYDDIIWTLDGLRNHPFWENQRQLAKVVLNALEKIQL